MGRFIRFICRFTRLWGFNDLQFRANAFSISLQSYGDVANMDCVSSKAPCYNSATSYSPLRLQSPVSR